MPKKKSHNTNNNLLLTGIIFLLVATAVFSLKKYLGAEIPGEEQEVSIIADTASGDGPLPTQPLIDTLPIAKEIKWRTESVKISKETEVSGKENIDLAIQLPTNWSLKTVNKASSSNNLIKNCADYVVSSPDSTAMLTISPICEGWAAEYSNWPQNAVAIKEEKNVGSDSYTAYTVRYLDSVTNQYKYVEGEVSLTMDAVLVKNSPRGGFLPTHILLTYSGKDEESTLSITDKIVTSLKIQ